MYCCVMSVAVLYCRVVSDAVLYCCVVSVAVLFCRVVSDAVLYCCVVLGTVVVSAQLLVTICSFSCLCIDSRCHDVLLYIRQTDRQTPLF